MQLGCSKYFSGDRNEFKVGRVEKVPGIAGGIIVRHRLKIKTDCFNNQIAP